MYVAFDRCAPLDVHQFQPVTAAAVAAASGGKEASGDGDEEVSAVMEINDETGAFEYTLYSLKAPPYIRLYVPGSTLSCSALVVITITRHNMQMFDV